MAQRLFQKRMLESEMPAESPPQFPRAPDLPRGLEFTVAGGAACTLKTAQGLRALGYGDREIAQTLEALKTIREASGREMNPVVFAKVKERYRMKIGVSAALASLCTQEAADRGLVFRSLVRFFKRNRMKESDLDDVEAFVLWILSRDETIKGVGSAWTEYKRLK